MKYGRLRPAVVDLNCKTRRKKKKKKSSTNNVFFCIFSFSDVENVDWPTIKNTLSSSDSWSICRLGDYFVRTGKNKRRRSFGDVTGNEKMIQNHNDNEKLMSNSDCSSNSTDEFDVLDDICQSQPLFRLMPQMSNNSTVNIQPIIEPG